MYDCLQRTYLSDDDFVVDLVKDVHSYFILATDLQHPVVAGGDAEPCIGGKIIG